MPNFAPGSFRLPSRTMRFGDTRVEPYDGFNLLFERGGVPTRLEYMTMFVGERLDALELCHQPTLSWYLSLISAGLNKGDPQVDRYFGRVVIASLELNVVIGLAKNLKNARDYWIDNLQSIAQDRSVYARDRLITIINLLSRLVVRFGESEAIAVHLETVELCKALGANLRFSNDVGILLKNSFEAVSPAARSPMFYADLDLPLSGQNDSPEPTDWIGAVQLREPLLSQSLRVAVAKYLDIAATNGNQRSAAIGRLAQLHFLNALTADEISRFASAAWGQVDTGNPPLPADTSIYDHFWAKLPIEGRDAAGSVQARLFMAKGPFDRERLVGMIRAVRSGSIEPDAEQARELFDNVVALRFEAIDRNNPIASFRASMSGYDPLQEANVAGAALTWALAPTLAADDRTLDRFKSLELFQEETASFASIGAMVPFVDAHTEAKISIERLIRRGLTSHDSQQVAYAVEALRLWTETHSAGPSAPSDHLVDQVISLVELRLSSGLSYLLAECERLARKGRLSVDQFQRTQIALGDLLEETNYSRIVPLSEQAGMVSLIREGAARLAAALNDLGHASKETEAWSKAMRDDPLPEVRQALYKSDE